MVTADDVRATASFCTTFLAEHAEADWTVPVPDLEMTVAGAVAHISEGCIWYAIDLAAGGKDLDPVEHRVKIVDSNVELIDTLRTYATVAAAVIEASPHTARGFHPMGAADPSGFAAMACDEMLIHTDDAARGLETRFAPPPDLADRVLRRLFPWVAPGPDPWAQLRWANGRIELDGQDRLSGWAWHCAPLDEWDGTTPTRT